MPVESLNLFGPGGGLTETPDKIGAQRPAVDELGLGNQREAVEANDRAYATQARQLKDAGRISEAQDAVSQIRDGSTRIRLFRELFGSRGSQDPPADLYTDGDIGVRDPLALFFMMVFYLDKLTPKFSWDQVLNVAKSRTNLNFNSLTVDDSFLPQRQSADLQPVVTTKNPQAQAEAVRRQVEREIKEKTDAVNKQRDAVKKSLSANSSGSVGGGGSIIVWPFQNMPEAKSGFSKSVEWPSVPITSLAEPILNINKGAGPVEIDLEFTYAVGIPGIGDSGQTAVPTPPSSDDEPSQAEGTNEGDTNWWTAEEIMGMMYLATSLVYPFKSSKFGGSAEREKENPAGQFPVVFLRHYSLFPFLSPFVVKQVKIEPDESQPLIITERNQINDTNSNLSFPAVRQVVKITLSLISAHYYAALFADEKFDPTGQIQAQTSGSTYLGLANQLLRGRV
jgi:hypothetical protein